MLYEVITSKLSDLLLASGFGNPYGTDEEERTMQALHDAILDALFNGGVLPEETIEKLVITSYSIHYTKLYELRPMDVDSGDLCS